jgi:hypothetical protein
MNENKMVIIYSEINEIMPKVEKKNLIMEMKTKK